ncbi:MAG: glycosyltransferase family 2 protein [Candidatus Omnitrophota bacterium]
METTHPRFSVVVPILNEKESLDPLVHEIAEAMRKEGWAFEALFVDDGSTDGSVEILERLAREWSFVRLFKFRRRQGKAAALACGFQHARGDYILTLDGDLQDVPGEAVRLWQAMQTRHADLVSGWKKVRRDPWHKVLSSRLFNGLTAFITGVRVHDFNCGLKLYRAEVVREIPLYGELHRFIPALAAWKGFRVTEEPVLHRPRRFGRSKFGPERIFAMMADLSTVLFLMRFEGKPSHFFSGAGLLLFLIGCCINGDLLFRKLAGGTIAPHYPYMVLGITALLVGIQFIFFGLLSEMMLYFLKREKSSARFSTSEPSS